MMFLMRIFSRPSRTLKLVSRWFIRGKLICRHFCMDSCYCFDCLVMGYKQYYDCKYKHCAVKVSRNEINIV